MIKYMAYVVVACWSMGISNAHGGFLTTLTVITTPEAGGLTLYSYTLTDQPTSTINAEVFILQVSSQANLQTITGPDTWDLAYNPGDSQVIWSSPDPSTDLLPGSSASFTLESSLPPILQDFQLFGADSSGTVFGSNPGNRCPWHRLCPRTHKPDPAGNRHGNTCWLHRLSQ